MRLNAVVMAGTTMLAAITAACSTGEAPPNDLRSPAPADSPGESAPAAAGNTGAIDTAAAGGATRARDTLSRRPETIADTLQIEGMREVRRATLVRAPEGLDLPFSTYLPDGMTVDFRPQPDGAGARFVAAFAGVVEPEAYMQVHMHPPGTTVEQARGVVARFLAGKTERSVDAPAWAEEARGFDYDEGGERYTGRVVLARHGARVFRVIQHYPPDYGDGLGPRFHSILKHWRWEDTGESLIRGSEARR